MSLGAESKSLSCLQFKSMVSHNVNLLDWCACLGWVGGCISMREREMKFLLSCLQHDPSDEDVRELSSDPWCPNTLFNDPCFCVNSELGHVEFTIDTNSASWALAFSASMEHEPYSDMVSSAFLNTDCRYLPWASTLSCKCFWTWNVRSIHSFNLTLHRMVNYRFFSLPRFVREVSFAPPFASAELVSSAYFWKSNSFVLVSICQQFCYKM